MGKFLSFIGLWVFLGAINGFFIHSVGHSIGVMMGRNVDLPTVLCIVIGMFLGSYGSPFVFLLWLLSFLLPFFGYAV